MKKLSSRINALAPSLTVSITTRAAERKAAGEDIISLSAGEPDFDTPDHIKQAAIEAIQQGYTKYTAPAGIFELRQAVCARLLKDHGINYSPEQVVITAGAKQAVYFAIRCLCEPGDEFIIPSPYWVTYPELVKLAGGHPVFLPCAAEQNFMPHPAALREAITPRTKALIINHPCNPTGTLYSKEILNQLSEIVIQHDLYVISDEIYEKIIYGGNQFISLAGINAEMQQRTILINGLSKAYAMTGWRVGFLAANPAISKTIANLQAQCTHHPSSISQKAAVTALNEDQSFIKQMVKEFSERRKWVLDFLADIPELPCSVPQGAFYVFPDFSRYYGKKFGSRKIKDSLEMADYLLQEEGVALVPGAAFGNDRCLRISYATSQANLEKGLTRIRSGLKKLK